MVCFIDERPLMAARQQRCCSTQYKFLITSPRPQNACYQQLISFELEVSLKTKNDLLTSYVFLCTWLAAITFAVEGICNLILTYYRRAHLCSIAERHSFSQRSIFSHFARCSITILSKKRCFVSSSSAGCPNHVGCNIHALLL